MFVCVCRAVTDHDIRQAIADGNDSTSAIAKATQAATQCGSCLDEIAQLIEAHKENNNGFSATPNRLFGTSIGTPEVYGI